MSEEESKSDANREKISISLPRDLVVQIETYAKDRSLKRSTVVQRALKQLLDAESDMEDEDQLWEDGISDAIGEIKSSLTEILEHLDIKPKAVEIEMRKIQPPSPKRAEILELFDDCSDSEFSDFDIEDDEGFLEQVTERGLTGIVWTDDLLRTCAEYLKAGYDDYSDFTRPLRKELLARACQAMKLDERQKQVLTSAFRSLFSKGKKQAQSEAEREKETDIDKIDIEVASPSEEE